MAVLTYSSRGVSCRSQDRKIWSTGEHVNGAPKLGFLAWKIDKKNYIAIPLMSDGKEGPPLYLRELFQQFLAESKLHGSNSTSSSREPK